MSTEVKFGLYAIIAGILWVVVEHLVGLNTTYFEAGEYSRGLFIFLPWAFIYFGIRAKRNQAFGPNMRWVEGFKIGALISGIYSIGYIIVFWLYATFINTSYYTLAKNLEQKKLISAGISGADLSMALDKKAAMYSGTPISYIMLFLAFWVFGLVVASVSSLFLKRKRAEA